MLTDFDEWYQAEFPRVVATIASMTGEVDVAAEASAEAFARALERWDKVSVMDSPGGWVHQVALNHARRMLRRRVSESSLLRRDRRRVVDGPAGEIWSIVAGLPPRQREAIALRHVAHLREAEIAVVMGVRRGTVSRTLRDAHESLRRQIRAEQGVHDA